MKKLIIMFLLIMSMTLFGCEDKDEKACQDARNACSIYLAGGETDEGGAIVEEGTVFEVTIDTKNWYYTYEDNGLTKNEENPHKEPKHGKEIKTDYVDGFPENVTMYEPKESTANSGLIEKKRKKDAYSDAKNAISIYLAERTNAENCGDVLEDGMVLEVEILNKSFYFVFNDNGIMEADNIYEAPKHGDEIYVGDIENFPENVTMYAAGN